MKKHLAPLAAVLATALASEDYLRGSNIIQPVKNYEEEDAGFAMDEATFAGPDVSQSSECQVPEGKNPETYYQAKITTLKAMLGVIDKNTEEGNLDKSESLLNAVSPKVGELDKCFGRSTEDAGMAQGDPDKKALDDQVLDLVNRLGDAGSNYLIKKYPGFEEEEPIGEEGQEEMKEEEETEALAQSNEIYEETNTNDGEILESLEEFQEPEVDHYQENYELLQNMYKEKEAMESNVNNMDDYELFQDAMELLDQEEKGTAQFVQDNDADQANEGEENQVAELDEEGEIAKALSDLGFDQNMIEGVLSKMDDKEDEAAELNKEEKEELKKDENDYRQ